MHTQIIVCNNINFDNTLKQHELGIVMNRIKIKSLPCVVNLSFLLKIIDMPVKDEINTEIRIVDSLSNILMTRSYVHRNYREKDEIPGVDQDFIATILIEEIGTLFIECYINENKVNWYPVKIILEEK
ncbi:hypothetical protein M5X06_08920 [Paenibacillus alvei]|uniref:Uncharacterized protein n=1 Tax=Paenibacillus alvei TaxID=44250 RepID=A0ABT4H5R2_PAEAL|nr:hypothetical protein [Paenibacillus alvei]MCY9764328.1 hypothetical protein [Paenibacillus alvei]MCY9766954.1 hypothetical protein [Paenibacillus alvei]